MKILIADDHAPSRKLIREFLPERDALVIECANGAEAVRLYKLQRPDWVLMDIEMPVMDGLTALRFIRERSADARVVIVTQHSSESLRREAAESGALAYVTKDDLTPLREHLKPRTS